MGSAYKPAKNPPTTSSDTEEKNPNLTTTTTTTNNNNNMESESVAPLTIEGLEEDSALAGSEFLSREEVIRRRFRRVKQLKKCYQDHYWALVDQLRVQYKDYYWKYGKSPIQEEEDEADADGGGKANNGDVPLSADDNNGHRQGLGLKENRGGVMDGMIRRCIFNGCKSKAMPFTNYCHPHILSDPNQKLYKPCTYVIKSVPSGPIYCGKPILKATVPSLCNVHFQKAQTHVTRALKKAGLSISSSSKLAPKFHVLLTESVRHINTKRRERKGIAKAVFKEECAA